MPRLVCISDTHNRLDQVQIPDGDILIHSGDLTNRGTLKEVGKAAFDLEKLRKRFSVIVAVAGNHDWLFERDPFTARSIMESAGVTYLEDSEFLWGGIRFWGSPVQPEFCNWAFNRKRGASIRKYWDKIPPKTDVLITHGPPYQILDLVVPRMEHVGCEELALAVARVRPSLHCFGHIHIGYGETIRDGIHYVNAAICDEGYSPVNKPIVVDL